MLLKPLEKGWIADYVKEHNLENTNAKDRKVNPQNTIYTKYVKRLLDIILALLACIVTFPVNLVLGACTFFDVGRPVFFFQKRIGKDGKKFTLVKFRNMRDAVDENGFWLSIDQRVTKFGSFVRRTSLDELLNFYSILKGDMSFIGPRPLPILYMQRYSERHKMRHAVRPGLECPDWKRKGYGIGWNEKLENDIWYVENVSFRVDCKMIIYLFRMVFDRKTRKEHANMGVGDFLGYDEKGKAFGALNIPDEYFELLKEAQEE